jgi:hypothetical protein
MATLTVALFMTITAAIAAAIQTGRRDKPAPDRF